MAALNNRVVLASVSYVRRLTTPTASGPTYARAQLRCRARNPQSVPGRNPVEVGVPVDTQELSTGSPREVLCYQVRAVWR